MESNLDFEELWYGRREISWGLHRSKAGIPLHYRTLLSWACPEIYQSSIRYHYIPPAIIPPYNHKSNGNISVAPSLVAYLHSARP
jgi:hypothetical protein